MNRASAFVSRFTPSLMTPETLEALLVQRESLVEQIVQGIRRSATTKAKHHALLIGPRGLGKTHVSAVVYNRVRGEKRLQSRLRIAWLREEERGVTSFLELLVRILTALAREYADAGLADDIQRLYDLSRKESEAAAAALLTRYLGKRTLLLIIENLDAIFAGLKEVGQKALRAYLQEHPICTILATSTSLFGGVSLQKSVFYGFFNVTHLGELSVDDAVGLLARIAAVRGDGELAEFVRTPVGRARVRAVHHLAGGNHRIYMVFSEFLSRASLDELVDPFMRMLDDLTPYYQSRLDLLSPQQQQIAELLTHVQGAHTVKEIARRCFITPQTAARQLSELRELGYVSATVPQRDRRETYYELREPLMRLCFEVKEYRGGPIRLFVDFLRHWYSQSELQQRLERAPRDAGLELACLKHALAERSTGDQDPRVAVCRSDLGRYMAEFDLDQAVDVTEEIAGLTGDPVDVGIHAALLCSTGRHAEALATLELALEHAPTAIVLRSTRSLALRGLERPEEASAALDDLLDAANGDVPIADVQGVANVLIAGGRHAQALALADRCVSVAPDNASSWQMLGGALAGLGRHQEALQAFDRALETGATDPGLLYDRFQCLVALGRYADAVEVVSQMPEHACRHLHLYTLRGLLLADLQRYDEALSMYDTAIACGDAVPAVWMARGRACAGLGRLDDAVDAFSKALVASEDSAAGESAASFAALFGVLRHPRATPRARARWLRAWHGLTANRDGLAAPMALLEAAVQYVDTSDDRVLLELPAEARSLVLRLLGLASDDGESAEPTT